MPPPANDLCINATVIAALPFSAVAVDISLATQSVDDPKPGVAGSGVVNPGDAALFHTIWYTWTSTLTGAVQLTGTNSNVAFAVFTGSCGAFTEILSWDTQMTVPVTSGTVYYIMLGSYAAGAPAPFTWGMAVSTDATNQFMITASDIGSLPVTLAPDTSIATDGGGHELWYRYTGDASPYVIGAFAFGNLVGLNATIDVFTSPVDYYTPAIWPLGEGISTVNKPIQLPVGDGVTVYFRLLTGAPGGVISFDLLGSPTDTVPVGAIFVNDDNDGFPLALLSGIDGSVLAFADVPATEVGTVLNDGHFFLSDAITGGGNVQVLIYNPNLTLSHTVALVWQGLLSVGSNKTDTFYLGNPGSGANKAKIITVTVLGTVSVLHTFAGLGLLCLAPSPDETILYYSGDHATSIGASIKRWDLVNSVGLTDLSAGIAGYIPNPDLLVLDDGTILVGFQKQTATVDQLVKHYAADGTVLNTYSFGTDGGTTTTRLAHALDDPNSFWIWLHGIGSGLSRFTNIKVSDGSTIATFDALQFEAGIYQGTATATPSTRFGHSNSCPFFLMRITSAPPTLTNVSAMNCVRPGYQSLTMTGTGFIDSPLVTVTSPTGDTVDDVVVTYISETELRVAFTAVEFGQYCFTVTNPSEESTSTFCITATCEETQIIRRLRRTTHLSNENLWTYFEQLTIAYEAGTGLTTGFGTDPTLMLRWSDDGGHVFSQWHTIEIGKLGQYTHRAIWRRLGRSRDRIFELVHSHPTKIVLMDGYIDASEGTS